MEHINASQIVYNINLRCNHNAGNGSAEADALYIIVINNVITIKDLDKIWELVVYNINL